MQHDVLQLQTIISKCDQGKDVSNLQIRGMLIAIATILQNRFQSSAACNCSLYKQHLQKEFQHKIQTLRGVVESKVRSLNCQIQQIVDVNQKQAKVMIQDKIQRQEKRLQQLITSSNRNLMGKINDMQRKTTAKYQLDRNWKQRITSCQIKIEQIVKNRISIEKKIEHLFLSNSKMEVEQKSKENKQQENSNKIQNKNQGQGWVDPQCAYFDRLTITQSQIKAKQWAYVFGKSQLRQNDSFIVKIASIKQKFQVGVIDRSLKLSARLADCTNWIYYKNNGFVWDGKNGRYSQPIQFFKGDTIKVQISLSKGIISWQTNNYTAQLFCNSLKSNQIKWVPFIGLFHEGDSVSIIK